MLDVYKLMKMTVQECLTRFGLGRVYTGLAKRPKIQTKEQFPETFTENKGLQRRLK